MRILTEPDASLTEQYAALLETEDVKLEFSDDGVRRIAEIACHVNERTENIGARRLHTVMERLLEAISFEAPDRAGQAVTVAVSYTHLDVYKRQVQTGAPADLFLSFDQTVASPCRR